MNEENDASDDFTPRAKKVLELSFREALQLGHNYIGTEHILLGLIREGSGIGVKVLISLEVDLSDVRKRVMALLAGYNSMEAAEQAEKARTPTQLGDPGVVAARAVAAAERSLNEAVDLLPEEDPRRDLLMGLQISVGGMADLLVPRA